MPAIASAVVVSTTLARASDTYSPLHHGGDAHSALWWISFLSIVVTGLVAAMVVCIVFALRAANLTSADVAAKKANTSGRRAARRGPH